MATTDPTSVNDDNEQCLAFFCNLSASMANRSKAMQIDAENAQKLADLFNKYQSPQPNPSQPNNITPPTSLALDAANVRNSSSADNLLLGEFTNNATAGDHMHQKKRTAQRVDTTYSHGNATTGTTELFAPPDVSPTNVAASATAATGTAIASAPPAAPTDAASHGLSVYDLSSIYSGVPSGTTAIYPIGDDGLLGNWRKSNPSQYPPEYGPFFACKCDNIITSM